MADNTVQMRREDESREKELIALRSQVDELEKRQTSSVKAVLKKDDIIFDFQAQLRTARENCWRDVTIEYREYIGKCIRHGIEPDGLLDWAPLRFPFKGRPPTERGR